MTNKGRLLSTDNIITSGQRYVLSWTILMLRERKVALRNLETCIKETLTEKEKKRKLKRTN